MRPKDFWRLHPKEFYWLLEARKPQKRYGDLAESDIEAIYRETYGDD